VSVARAHHHAVIAKFDRPLVAVGREMADVQNGPAGLQFDSPNAPLRPRGDMLSAGGGASRALSADLSPEQPMNKPFRLRRLTAP